ncbi:saccharopine dehydrogenase NADP-binding domain-containing protein [Actinomadura violacea]|uniref:Saccharopine dehydrogenase NADP-binding domain-containing protein n=1 Tax=Actinomadura violacea TaxID=2819934 RepID=A0ABS3RV11_9ACTN|nr:saccharopine dehydrogenase NADP-binding domain-containing protein [Actinomadura violacea]MBO2460558.1 saccharopine dehydrogenase NADP-binding domain-containing protein [Actinomadura violacea]
MRRVVVLGGYGAVGREVVAGLRGHVPELVVAGRDPAGARPVDGAVPMRIDLRTGDLGRIDADAVVMCAEVDNARVAEACLARGVHYVDVSASYEMVAPIERLDGLAAARNASAVLSVGLAPGVTNLLAREFGGADVDIGVLLGAGERHGPSAVEWTLASLGDLGESWRMRFPEPFGTRTVHRFPFSDQRTLPGRVRTGLALDSRVLTALLPRLAPFRGAAALRAAFRHVHAGGDRFAVVAASGGAVRSFSGRRQSRATGLAAALAVQRLAETPPGVRHLHDAAGPDFLAELAAQGFRLGHYDAG